MQKFSNTLVNLERGKVAYELDGAMEEVVRAIAERGGKGSVTLTMSLKTAGHNMKVLEVAATVKKVLPDRQRAVSVFFVNKEFGLQRNDPDQEELKLNTEIKGGVRDGAAVDWSKPRTAEQLPVAV
jgi:hypothetical protein